MNIESRGASLPHRSSDELRAQINLRKTLGYNFSPQVGLPMHILADLAAAVLWWTILASQCVPAQS